MATQVKTAKAAKVVQVIARYEIKRNGAVVYSVRSSSNPNTTYQTTLVNGKATGCTCPAAVPCFHRIQLEAREAARREARETARAYREIAFASY